MIFDCSLCLKVLNHGDLCSCSLLGRVVFSSVHRPDDDDLLQALGGGGRRSQLLHQSVERVRVDGLLLVGVEGHLVGGGDGGVSGLRLEALDDGGCGG